MLARALLGLVVAAAFFSESNALADNRIALLIGNQDYKLDALDLQNPHNDVAVVGAALKQVGFDVRIVRDAGFGRLQKEVNRYTKRLRRAGKDAVGFFYYSGHGALNEQNRYNYLIPTDVETDDSADLWDGSIRLKRIVSDLKDQASNAIHFVVFDACRNELKLSTKSSKSLRQSKGFKPIRENVRGMLVAYATAEGEIASDVGKGVGPYAKALARWITTPGVEAVTMFREVQVSVYNAIGQEPWYAHGALKRFYFAGRGNDQTETQPQSPLGEAAQAWRSIASSNNVSDYETFRRRYGKAEPFYDDLAKNRIEQLSGNTTAPPSRLSVAEAFQVGQEASRTNDWARAAPHYRLAAEAGHARSMALYGYALENGFGVRQDRDEAIRWFRRASEKGDVQGTFSLAWANNNGFGTSADPLRAAELFLKIIASGENRDFYINTMFKARASLKAQTIIAMQDELGLRKDGIFGPVLRRALANHK